MPYLSPDEASVVIEPRPLPGFVQTPYIHAVTNRTLNYLKAGFPVHFRGPSGTGKTTLAMHVASHIGRPVILIHGDDQLKTSDLVGGEHGFRHRYLRDNFIASVLKVEEDMTKRWIDSRLTIACKHGLTLIYDEFTRSRPEANNILLSILQEGLMDLPAQRDEDGEGPYLKVHPEFRAIFTSNPEEYAGVHKSQDALRDRMVTMDLDYFDRETEIAIVRAKAGLSRHDAERIVAIVRGVRESGEYEFVPTVRACIMIARALKTSGARLAADDPVFRQICIDLLTTGHGRAEPEASQGRARKFVEQLIKRYTPSSRAGRFFAGLLGKKEALPVEYPAS